MVQVSSNIENVKSLQRGHGEWSDATMLPVSYLFTTWEIPYKIVKLVPTL